MNFEKIWMKKKISILGSTGSIGKQALEVIDSLNGHFEVIGLSAGKNIELLKQQIHKYKPEIVSVKDEEASIELQKEIKNIKVIFGKEGLQEMASLRSNELVLIAVTGFAGLYPTLAAVENGVNIALANKESLVAAGNIVMEKARNNNVSILPVDSEHSAIHQCVKDFTHIEKLIITASGGPFRQKTLAEMAKATVEETLAHPRWSMGSKITVHSATLMNKGLEVIEAHHLFNIDYKDVEVIIHPQSIIHGAVELIDGSTIAQLGVPSMHIPIQYALTYPARHKGLESGSLKLTETAKLEFEAPDLEKFPCLELAYKAGINGGIAPVVLNAANEEAVNSFLEGKIKLTDICCLVKKAVETIVTINNPSVSDIISADSKGREVVRKLINQTHSNNS